MLYGDITYVRKSIEIFVTNDFFFCTHNCTDFQHQKYLNEQYVCLIMLQQGLYGG